MKESSHFNAEKTLDRSIDKYKLDHSTFDLIDVDRFHNTKWGTVFGYMWEWVLVFLAWALLGIDIYTCLNILVFHRWSDQDYRPYAYSVAKWLFTGCIIFEFILLGYHWFWAIHTYKTKNIALVFVNSIARVLYTIKSYNYHCLFHKIQKQGFLEWAAFFTYTELDGALQILFADTPRQVINILTLRYYATDFDTSNDIVKNIREIATTNFRLSVILSFICLSFCIWCFFFIKFVFAMILLPSTYYKVRKQGYRSLKSFCCQVVNENVRKLVLKYHKPKNLLLKQGVLDVDGIKANPLLNSHTETFDKFNYNDNKKLYDLWSRSSDTVNDEEYQMDSLKHNPYSSNPFDDNNRNSSKESLMDSISDHSNPFASKTSLLHSNHHLPQYPSKSLTNSNPNHDLYNSFGNRNQSLSSLSYGNNRYSSFNNHPFGDSALGTTSKSSLLHSRSDYCLNDHNEVTYNNPVGPIPEIESNTSNHEINVSELNPSVGDLFLFSNQNPEIEDSHQFDQPLKNISEPEASSEYLDQTPSGIDDTKFISDSNSILPSNISFSGGLDVKMEDIPYPVRSPNSFMPPPSTSSSAPYPVRGVSIFDKSRNSSKQLSVGNNRLQVSHNLNNDNQHLDHRGYPLQDMSISSFGSVHK